MIAQIAEIERPKGKIEPRIGETATEFVKANGL